MRHVLKSRHVQIWTSLSSGKGVVIMAVYRFRIEKDEDSGPARHKCEWDGCPNLGTETLINFQGIAHRYCKSHASNIIDYVMGMDGDKREQYNWGQDDPREDR